MVDKKDNTNLLEDYTIENKEVLERIANALELNNKLQKEKIEIEKLNMENNLAFSRIIYTGSFTRFDSENQANEDYKNNMGSKLTNLEDKASDLTTKNR